MHSILAFLRLGRRQQQQNPRLGIATSIRCLSRLRSRSVVCPGELEAVPLPGAEREISAACRIDPSVLRKELWHATVLGAQEKGSSKFIIDPRIRWMRAWDILAALALVFTATVTPFEVSFLSGGLNGLFWVNRLIDTIFLIDMVLQFFLAYYDEEDDIWIYENRQICMNYLGSWFVVDFLGVLPFDILGIVFDHDNLDKLKIIRIVKLLRLAKLLRVLKVGRIFQRLEASISISYKTIQLCAFGIAVMLCAHWMACALYLCTMATDCTVEALENDECTDWVHYYNANGGNEQLLRTDEDGSLLADPVHGMPVVDNARVYLAAFYWAVMTMSTIGYGDVTPQTDVERIYVTIGMVLGAAIYAYMVGNVCSIIASLNVSEEKFRHQMDSLNQFMSSHSLPKELKQHLRQFYRYRHSNMTIHESQEVLRTLTPKLQAQVAGYTQASWLQDTDVFKGFPPEMVVDLCLSMKAEVCVPGELVFEENSVCDRLYIVERGLVWYRGSAYTRPQSKNMSKAQQRQRAHWIGVEDMNSLAGLHRFSAYSLTYSILLSLRREVLEAMLNRYPSVKATFRAAMVRTVAREIILLYCQTLKRFTAAGSEVHDLLMKPQTTEQHQGNWMLKHKFMELLRVITFTLGESHPTSKTILEVINAALRIQACYRGYRTRKQVVQLIQYAEYLEGKREEKRGHPRLSVQLSEGKKLRALVYKHIRARARRQLARQGEWLRATNRLQPLEGGLSGSLSGGPGAFRQLPEEQSFRQHTQRSIHSLKKRIDNMQCSLTAEVDEIKRMLQEMIAYRDY